MIDRDYLLLWITLVFVVTNFLGAAFTIRRVYYRWKESRSEIDINPFSNIFAHELAQVVGFSMIVIMSGIATTLFYHERVSLMDFFRTLREGFFRTKPE
jgi:hypothetical protein